MISISSNCLSRVKTTGICFLIRGISKAIVFVRIFGELTWGSISAKKKMTKKMKAKDWQ